MNKDLAKVLSVNEEIKDIVSKLDGYRHDNDCKNYKTSIDILSTLVSILTNAQQDIKTNSDMEEAINTYKLREELFLKLIDEIVMVKEKMKQSLTNKDMRNYREWTQSLDKIAYIARKIKYNFINILFVSLNLSRESNYYYITFSIKSPDGKENYSKIRRILIGTNIDRVVDEFAKYLKDKVTFLNKSYNLVFDNIPDDVDSKYKNITNKIKDAYLKL